jgi:hypothetical protein
LFQAIVMLVGYGVPYGEAMNMSDARRLAWIVAKGERDGKVYDWQAMRWAK